MHSTVYGCLLLKCGDKNVPCSETFSLLTATVSTLLGLIREAWIIFKNTVFRIRAEIGYRIELKFDAFYLLGSPATNKGCHIQHLSIRDMLSGITDGRYCGNTLPPSMVSTGKYKHLEKAILF